ncbi:MAG: hypothetical protein RJB01_1672, partial [Actinomycetota bacterium]
IGDSDFGRRPVKFMSDDHFKKLRSIAAHWDPDGVFVGYLSDQVGLTNINTWQQP